MSFFHSDLSNVAENSVPIYRDNILEATENNIRSTVDTCLFKCC